jgi:hypothetical protein
MSSRWIVLLLVATVLAGCRSIEAPTKPLTVSRGAQRGAIEDGGGSLPTPDNHTNPRRIEARQVMETIVLFPPPGRHFSPFDRVSLSSRYRTEDQWDNYRASTCVAYRHVTLGVGYVDWGPGPHRSDIEAAGGAVVAVIRPNRAQIWFQNATPATTMEVRVGEHTYQIQFPVEESPVPLDECVWVDGCRAAPCSLGDGDDPDIYPKRPRVL